MTETMTLTGFLLARIAEDEEVARAAADLDLEDPADPPAVPGRWEGRYGDVRSTWRAWSLIVDQGQPADVAHIARFDPARVLAECEAKRRIVEECDGDWCFHDATTGGAARREWVLIYLALPYADHPDYRDGWRP